MIRFWTDNPDSVVDHFSGFFATSTLQCISASYKRTAMKFLRGGTWHRSIRFSRRFRIPIHGSESASESGCRIFYYPAHLTSPSVEVISSIF